MRVKDARAARVEERKPEVVRREEVGEVEERWAERISERIVEKAPREVRRCNGVR